MKKIILPTLLLSFMSTAVFAQIPTLTAANINPVVNDSFVTVVCDTAGIVQGPSGASQTWNFSSTLVPTTIVPPIDTGNVVYAAAAPGYTVLSTFASLIPSATFATSTHAIVTPASSISNFYAESTTKLSTTGVYLSTSSNALYTDPIDVLRFPFTYLNTYNDNYAGVVTFLGTTATEAGTVATTADAYGTLILPPTPPSMTPVTYTGVLRVHSYQLFRDSANIFGSPVIQTDTIETYTWYQPGYHSALMTITTTRGFMINNKVVSYASKQIANHVSVPGVTGESAQLKLYPNPASDELNINFSTAKAEHVKITLVDIQGKEIAVIADQLVSGNQIVNYKTSALPKGLYFIQQQSAEGITTRKLEIQ